MSFRSKRFVSLMIFMASIFGGKQVQAQGTVPDDVERAVLMALYNATDGENSWTTKWRLTQINSYPDPDSVPKGVGVSNGDIVSVQLDSYGLQGTLPAELNKLVALKVLSLSANQLTGVIPALDSLSDLQTLNLTSNNFSGTFPAWIGKLSNLVNLYLSNTHLTGPIHSSIGDLTNLNRFDFSNNNLSMDDAIPDSFSKLDNLTFLNLNSCLLTPSSVESGLTGLNRLQTLYMNNNSSFVDMDGTMPSRLLNLPTLQYLYLEGNGFNKFPSSFSSLTALYYLDLSWNNYSSTVRLSSTIDELKNILSLKLLNLTYTQIVSLPDDFNELTIEWLDLSNNPTLSPEGCNLLGDMPKLRDLYMNYCNLTSLPSGLSRSESLKNLYVNNNSLNPLPEVIKIIPHLQSLEATSNRMETLPEWFGTMSMDTLRRLVLSNNSLTTLPNNFVKMKNLQELIVANNHLNGNWPLHFDDLKALRILDLRTNLIDSLPDLSKLPSLHTVYLQENRLRGKVPAFLSDKSKIIVDISSNKYSSIDTTAHFTGTPSNVNISDNDFTFLDVLAFKPAQGRYTYSPQPRVDTTRNVFSYPGSSFMLVAAIDTTLIPKARFQWFKYVNGVNDSALFSFPSESAYKYTVLTTRSGDEGDKYYYKITHPAAPGLVLVSQHQTLVFTCKGLMTGVGFTSKRFLCAMNFTPAVKYTASCRSLSYEWDFGDDASSQEESPWHAYGGEGIFTVSMRVHYTCGPCQSDTTIVKQVNFSLPQQFLSDSTITIDTDVRKEILSVSATTFSDSWPLSHPAETANVNSFLSGTQGVWRNDGAYVYDVPRPRGAETNIATDGTFALEHFNWAHAELNAIPDWTKANTITKYSPYSYELENQDVLGIYSAALYDYGGHLPSATGVNMRNDEMAFTSFEYLEQKSSGNFVFGNQALPDYYIYKVKSARNHIAVVEASPEQLANVQMVDVNARAIFGFFLNRRRTNYIQDNPLLCVQRHPTVPTWSMIVLRRKPFDDLWIGQIKVKNELQPVITPVIDTRYAHTGKSSLKITAATTFEQKLLKLDSAKNYFINAWVSVHDAHTTTPKLADGLGIDVTFRDENGVVLNTKRIVPEGPVIEGWQQVRGTVTCPDNLAVVELTFQPGSTGSAWYDDLRLHPEKGNMKTYVYNVDDYRLRAVLDEENFASLYFYDDEGNLYLVKKETERGIKTISENISHQVKNSSVQN